MRYIEYQPHSLLSRYVDAYWTSMADGHATETVKILPDGCVDLIVNLGDDCMTDNGASEMQHNKVYLVGTMLQYKLVEVNPGTRLMGIRFKPGAFNAFYRFASLHEVTDCTVEFEHNLLPGLKKLDGFLLNKLSPPKHNLLSVIADIEALQGRISVAALAKRHFNTTRMLERNFKQYIGISPKEFINFVRYNAVLKVLKNKPAAINLFDLAQHYGFYDHAHLTHEVKRYTGVTPSQL